MSASALYTNHQSARWHLLYRGTISIATSPSLSLVGAKDTGLPESAALINVYEAALKGSP